ncbi:hypothetical protein [Fulvivirga lutea]|uniref:Uncharacterized protein n=1 Tax=Fulvivirga lutea TaxID=2810512 RepID=A0A974WHM3_9BACT|nr:hypothetical protein [Fulvivirga lutea]QSE97402.1 hypothetical protein JR347_17750 [Fulvivirga lutea]
MTSDEKLDIINSFLSPMIKEKFSKAEIEKICKELYLCNTRDELSHKIDYYAMEFAHRGEIGNKKKES